jgi:hypothetical protein
VVFRTDVVRSINTRDGDSLHARVRRDVGAAVTTVATRRKIFIGVPSYDGRPACLTSIMNAGIEAQRNDWEVVVYIRAGDSILPRARDVLVTAFVNSDCSDMLMVDADISWEIGAFTRIMSHQAHFVGGVYRTRNPGLDEYVCLPFKEDIVVGEDGLAEMQAVGCGFLRLTRIAVVSMISAQNYDNWYVDRGAPEFHKIYHLFDFTFDLSKAPEERLRSEDYVFCDRYRATGGVVYADTGLTLHHHAGIVNSGCFGEHLRRNAPLLSRVEQMVAE